MSILITIYLTGFIVFCIANLTSTFFYERPSNKYKYWMCAVESIIWFLLLIPGLMVAIYLFKKDK